MEFLHPALLAGTLLFAVPLVIHLLNRQRHKRRPWAAMEFLLRAYQKQKNRLRNENLLLLLLRCLIPIVLALAIARPIWQQIAGLLGTGGLVHHVIVFDASYSTGLRPDGGTTPFERARKLVAGLLDSGEQESDLVARWTLVAAGVRPRFLVRGDLDVQAARAGWLQLQKPDDAAGDLGEALRQVADFLDESKDPQVRVYVFSDLQRRSLGEVLASDAAGAPELTDTLRDLVVRIQERDGAEVHWIDTGPFAESGGGGTVDNVQVSDLRLRDPAAVERMPATVVATVQNRGTSPAVCEVTLDVDGAEPLRRSVDLPAGAAGEAEFQMTFREPGRRRLRASLLQDDLAADDERFLTVEVRDRIRVLLVDGAAGGDPLKSYGSLWRGLLDPDPESLPTFAVEVVDLLSLLSGQCRPQDHDVVVLADIERLNDRAAEALRDALRAGRGLLCQFGPHTDVDSFNHHLYGAGDGPMPVRLLTQRGGDAGTALARSPSIAIAGHPCLADFDEEIYREILQAIPIWRWLAATLPEPPATSADDPANEGEAPGPNPARSVVLTITDAEQSPLLCADDFGEGRAAFLLSPIGSPYDADRWNRLDEPLVALPLLHGLVKWLALPAFDPFLATVGGELTCTLAARPTEIELQRPERDGRGSSPVAGSAAALPGGRFALPPCRDALFAGFYVFDLVLERDDGKQRLSVPFAVNVDPADGDLQYAAHAEAASALGIERITATLPNLRSAGDTPDDNDLGPGLLWLLLLLVLGEATLARFVAARRS